MHRLQCLSLALKPFSRHSCLLHHHQQLMERVIGTSVMPMIYSICFQLLLSSIAFFFCLPSYSFLPPIVWISIHSIHMCRVDRCLDVGCGLVALVTSLLLRRLLSSSVPFFEITIPQSYQYNVLSQHFAIIYINRSSFFSSDFQPAHGRKDKVP